MSVKVVIDHIAGSRRGERQELEPAERLRFGRHPGNEIAFDTHADLDASAWHAELRREGGGWTLVDIGSSNGTFVDGRKIAREAISPGRSIEVEFGAGGPRCKLFVGDPTAALVPETIVARGRDGQALREAASKAMAAQAGTEGRTMRQTIWKAMQPVLHPTTKKFVFIQVALAVITVAIVATAFFVIVGVMSRKDPPAQPAAMTPEQQRLELEKMLEPGARIASDNVGMVFLVAYTDTGGSDRPLCTGFAVAGDVLATNAHCVDQIDEKEGAGLAVFAVRNRVPQQRFAVKQKKRHPQYRGPLSPDVGLVRLDGEVGAPVKLASTEELRKLSKGMRMYIYGFPGRVAHPGKPDASVGDGMIGRVTTFAGDPDDPAAAYLVQHSAETSPGASGSPIFNAKGEVIGINVGQYMEIQEQEEEDPVTGAKRKVQVPAGLAPGLNIAVRIDALDPLLGDWGIRP